MEQKFTEQKFFVGTYMPPEELGMPEVKGKGISVIGLKEDGTLRITETFSSIKNPSYLHYVAEENILLACSETMTRNSSVALLRPDKTGLRLLASADSSSRGDCHITYDAQHKKILTASYAEGTLNIFHADLSRGTLQSRKAHSFRGSGPCAERQERSHLHQAVLHQDIYFLPDLGADRIRRIPAGENPPLRDIPVPPGYGPRHLLFHPETEDFYLVCELKAALLHYSRRGEDWELREEFLLTDPQNKRHAVPAPAAIQSIGKALSVSVRGTNTLHEFRLKEDGTLRPRTVHRLTGKTPRDFIYTPDQKHLLIAFQDSHEIRLYPTDSDGFIRGEAWQSLSVGSPVCLEAFL